MEWAQDYAKAHIGSAREGAETMSDIIVAVMAVLVGATGLVAAGYLLFGLWESIYGLEEEVRHDIHLHSAHPTGTLAPHH